MSSILVSALALLAATAAAWAIVRNRIIRSRLKFSAVALLALIALHVSANYVSAGLTFAQVSEIERLLLALALINALVALLLNPWFQDRVFERSPGIVQDFLVIGVFGLAAVFLLQNSGTFLGASAIAAAAIGFALQDTLSNAFAGLAIQIEKPFRVGQWVSVAGFEGAVAEVTWRATKIRTKAGNLVVIPNNTIAKETINNYSEPSAPTRVFVEVGAAYGVPPNGVRDAMMTAMRQVPRLLASPPPDVLLHDFGASAIVYHARFWIDDFAAAEIIRNEVRQAIYYEFRRRGIEIPWPIQVEYAREETAQDTPERRAAFARAIAATPVLSALPADVQQALAEAALERLYAGGEVIVREGDPGRSMFLVMAGRVSVTIGPEAREVAVTETGGYFGEMSLLTGEPRSATVRAKGDCTLLEISADAFAACIRSRPETVDLLAEAAAARRRELDAARTERASAPVEPVTLAQRIRRFFGVSEAASRPGSQPRPPQ